MKILKTFFIGLLILNISCSNDNGDIESINDSTIGKIENNEIIITANNADLLKRFDKLALKDNIKVNYKNLEIRKIENNEYALFAFTDDMLIKSAISLVIDGTNLKVDIGGGKITCSTNGCSSNAGCMPVKKPTTLDPEVWYWTCTSCSSDCTKTTSN